MCVSRFSRLLATVLVLAPLTFLSTSCLGELLDPDNPFFNSGGNGENGENNAEVDDGNDVLPETTVAPFDDLATSEDNVANATFDRTISINWTAAGATATGDDKGFVTIEGSDVTVNNTGKEVILYVLSGSSSDGSLKIYGSKKQGIRFDGLSLTNKRGAAINNQCKKRCYVIVEGSNSLSDASSAEYAAVEDEDNKAVFFSEGQLIFSGSGSLTINALNAKGKAGLSSDDYVRFMSSPTITVNAGSSAGNAVRGKDYILVTDGKIIASASADMKKGFSSDSLVRFDGGIAEIKVTGNAAFDSDDNDYSGSAAIKADKQFIMTGGEVTLTSTGTGGKGIKVGSSSDETNQTQLPASYITGGKLSINVTGREYTQGDVSPKGVKIGWAIKSGNNRYSGYSGDLIISGGTISVKSTYGEALEAKGKLFITDGEVYAYSQAEDAINCVGNMSIRGGFVCAHSDGNDGIDANGNLYVKGGVIYAIGSTTPEVALDANTEGGFKLYVSGGTLFALGSLESGAALSQKCYQASSWSKETWYALSVGNDTYAFMTPSRTGSPIVVSGSETPTLKSGVTVNGGTSLFNDMARTGASVSGGKSVSLSSYSNSGGGPGMGGPGGGGMPRW